MPTFDTPFIHHQDGNKSLYFSFDAMQSSMCQADPSALDVDYTRTMMGFLMFQRQPRHLAMIGLGGGSLLKFCYRHLPQTQLTAIEINPHVMALRHEFEIPDDPARITLVCGDGADFVRDSESEPDVLLVDGFDRKGQAQSLCTQAFYNDCFQALAPQGMMVANLNPEHPDHALFMGRIALAFNGQVLEVLSEEQSNSIVFARKGGALSVAHVRKNDCLKNADPALRAQLQREFARIAWVMTEVD